MLGIQQLRDFQPVDKAVTSMVSFHIPPTYNMGKLKEKLTGELASCQNIKSRVNRQSVQIALTKVADFIKGWRGPPPPTGIAMFAEQHI